MHMPLIYNRNYGPGRGGSWLIPDVALYLTGFLKCRNRPQTRKYSQKCGGSKIQGLSVYHTRINLEGRLRESNLSFRSFGPAGKRPAAPFPGRRVRENRFPLRTRNRPPLLQFWTRGEVFAGLRKNARISALPSRQSTQTALRAHELTHTRKIWRHPPGAAPDAGGHCLRPSPCMGQRRNPDPDRPRPGDHGLPAQMDFRRDVQRVCRQRARCQWRRHL